MEERALIIKNCWKSQTSTPDALREDLQEYYNNTTVEEEDELSFNAGTSYIRLALVHKETDPLYVHGGVDQIVAAKTVIELEDIFAPNSKTRSQKKFILVEGPPGIGKTTFCKHLCKNWGSLKYLQDYKFLLNLKLRQEHVYKAKSLEELIACIRTDPTNKDIAAAIETCKGEGVLFVLDGFDEMPSAVVRNKCLVMDIICGKYLPKATCLVTSRPSALLDKNKYFPEHRHIEILGFTDERKVQFAQEAFKSEPKVAEHFKTFILSNPVIKSLMYVPVNCAIIARVYKDMKRDMKLMPRTMTQLYKALILALVKRHMIKRGEWGENTPVLSFESLPENVPEMKRVCRLAYKGLIKEEIQIEFTDHDTGEEFQHLGLLKEMKEKDVLKGVKISYSFLHLSIQEFLAACHVSWNKELVGKTLSQAFESFSDEKIHFRLFIAGMIGCQNFQFHRNSSYLLHCLYEAQVTNIGDYSFIPESCFVVLSTPIDMYALGYALVHTSVQWHLQVLQHTSWDVLASSLADNAPHSGEIAGSIVFLSLGKGCLPSNVTSLHNILQRLRKLKVHADSFSFCEILPRLQNLEDITLRVYEPYHDRRLYLALSELSHLKYLHLHFGYMSYEGLQNLTKSISNLNMLEHASICISDELYDKWSPSLMQLDFDQLMKAAFSKLKSLSMDLFLFKVTKRNIPSIVKNFELSLAVSSSLAFPEMILLDCLSSVAEVCEIPSVITKLSLNCEAHVTLFCNFLGILNNSNPSFKEIDFFSPSMNDPCTCSYLSRALRRDPAISTHNLRKSKSFTNLITSQRREPCRHYRSCPDLLEVQSLQKLHDTVRQGFTGNFLQCQHVSTSWLDSELERERVRKPL